MSQHDVDLKKRRFLTAATSVVAGAGAVMVAIPFVQYMTPSDRARAAGAPVEADISKLEVGQLIRVKWRGQPVWFVRRTEEMLKNLETLDSVMLDPDSAVEDQQPSYAQNKYRSIKDELLVAIGICTHLGCSPTFKPEVGGDLGPDWKGGFFCPCHGSIFDLAGRVYAGVPAPLNLVIPPHRYLSDTVIMIGEDEGAAS